MIANLGELDPFVEREVVEAFDHKYLNEEVAAVRREVPTAENVCREIYRRLKTFPAARLERVRIEETSKNSFEFAGENPAPDAHQERSAHEQDNEEQDCSKETTEITIPETEARAGSPIWSAR